MKIGIIGGFGFLGNAIRKKLEDHEVISITQENYDWSNINSVEYDLLINSNGNSKKYLANIKPSLDFKMNVETTVKYLTRFKFKKYIYMSSVDAIVPQDFYGFHKNVSEQIAERYTNNPLIFRCCALIGEGMQKGLIYDIINNQKVFLTYDSELQFINVYEVANVIKNLIDSNKINMMSGKYNLCGKGTVSVKEMEEIAGYPLKFDDNLSTQKYFNEPTFEYDFKTSREYVKEIINERME